MATKSGKDGLVKVSSNTVAEVRNWTLDLSADTIAQLRKEIGLQTT